MTVFRFPISISSFVFKAKKYYGKSGLKWNDSYPTQASKDFIMASVF